MACGEQVVVVGSGRRGHPQAYDVLAWRRWFKQRRGVAVDLFLSDRLAVGALAGAVLARAAVRVYLTGRLGPDLLRYAKWFAKGIGSFVCPAGFVERQLLRSGIRAEQLSVRAPAAAAGVAGHDVAGAGDGWRGAEGAGVGKGLRPVRLLAAAGPNDPEALKPVVWAGALLKHVMPEVRLTVAGRCEGRKRARLESWQRMMEAGQLLEFAGGRSWQELTSASDLLLSGHGLLSDVMRLMQARETGCRIIALLGDASELLAGWPNATLVSGPAPRELAGEALRILGGGAAAS